MIPDPFDDPLAKFELPPDVMSSTFEHAISDDADAAHEQGHAVAAALQKALKGSRSAYWDGRFQDAQVYEQSLLESGNVVRGLAFVESVNTTILVPPGSRYTTDSRLNGVMEEE